jgi:hypothetical protein
MALFWSKQVEPTRVTYTRSRRQKRLFYWLLLSGFILMFALPPLLAAQAFARLTRVWPALYKASFFPGPLLVIFVAFTVSKVNFKLFVARLRRRLFTITTTPDGDVVTIDR